MKRLTDKKKILRTALQSLPATLATIVILLYATTFLPLSTEKMERSTALIEQTSYYEICSGGKPVARFRTLDDNCMPDDLYLPEDSDAIDRMFTTGCFVNKYPMFPSCRGLILSINPDSTACERLNTANKKIRDIISEKADDLKESIARIDKEQEELDYYLSIHNVNDDGYNVMADYSEQLKRRKMQTERMAAALGTMSEKKRIEIKHIKKYTLLYKDTAGATRRMVCDVMSKDSGQPFCLLQTSDRRMPDGASALYIHQWLMPHTEKEDGVISASYPGCTSHGFTPGDAAARTFAGTVTDNGGHDIPRLLAPDGSPVFTADGRFAGISYKGAILPASTFGFKFKKLLP